MEASKTAGELCLTCHVPIIKFIVYQCFSLLSPRMGPGVSALLRLDPD